MEKLAQQGASHRSAERKTAAALRAGGTIILYQNPIAFAEKD